MSQHNQHRITHNAMHMIRLHGHKRGAEWAREHEAANIGRNESAREYWRAVAKEIDRLRISNQQEK